MNHYYREALRALGRPLQVLRRSDFQNLDSISNLETSLSSLVDTVGNTCDTEAKPIWATLLAVLHQWSGLSLEARVQCLEQLSDLFKQEPAPLDGVVERRQERKDDPARQARRLQKKQRLRQLLAREKGGDERAPSPAPTEALESETLVPDVLPVDIGDTVELKGIGPKMAQALAAAGIGTISDLVHFLPSGYRDRRTLKRVTELLAGKESVVEGVVTDVTSSRLHHQMMVEVRIKEESGELRLRWFHAKSAFSALRFARGQQLLCMGVPRLSRGQWVMSHPEVEILAEGEELAESYHHGRWIPVYPRVEGISHRRLRTWMAEALERYQAPAELLPQALLDRGHMPAVQSCLQQIHFPPAEVDADELMQRRTPAWRRLALQELWLNQVYWTRARRLRQVEGGAEIAIDADERARLEAQLPWPLTADQVRAVAEVLTDLERSTPMHRLIQGDVGSGKTVVAAMAAALTARAGWQVAVMVPTEMLAEQHFKTFTQLIEPCGYRLAILTAQSPRETYEAVAKGEIQIVIGTHVLAYERAQFSRLGLAIIDEQHKFGVSLRRQLVARCERRNVLVMTATPLPRTLTMTAFGDLDLSLIREKPPGRLPVVTEVVWGRRRDAVYQQVLDHIEVGAQVYLVYPALERANSAQAARDQFDELSRGVLQAARVDLVYGRQRADIRQRIMEKFAAGEIDVLVATSVVEVGIDVPNATMMVVHGAERFGLAQLHQLRGRISRGPEAGHLILVLDEATLEARERTLALAGTDDGFVVAEIDLKTRGAGDFPGLRQSGASDFRFADLARDLDLVVMAQAHAQALLDADPDLSAHGELLDAVSALGHAVMGEPAG